MKRWQVILLTTIVLVVLAVLGGYRMGVQMLQDKVVGALGPGSHLTELKVNWFTLELLGVRIDAP